MRFLGAMDQQLNHHNKQKRQKKQPTLNRHNPETTEIMKQLFAWYSTMLQVIPVVVVVVPQLQIFLLSIVIISHDGLNFTNTSRDSSIGVESYCFNGNIIHNNHNRRHHHHHHHPYLTRSHPKSIQTVLMSLNKNHFPFLPVLSKTPNTWRFMCTSSNNLIDDTNKDDDDEYKSKVVKSTDWNILEEETLLRIAMTIVVPQQQQQQQVLLQLHAIEGVAKFCQTFPFAAVLPVQPLQYFPVQITDDDDGNVNTNITDMTNSTTPTTTPTLSSNNSDRRRCIEVQFLRKKTPERGSLDGGIRFYIQPFQQQPMNIDNEETDDDDDDSHNNDQQQHYPSAPVSMIELIAKRNSQGQVITKIFAEKLIITNFVASFLGTANTNTSGTNNNNNNNSPSTSNKLLNLQLRYPSPIGQNIVQIQSIYHPWM